MHWIHNYNQQLITGALLSLQNCGQSSFVQHAVSDRYVFDTYKKHEEGDFAPHKLIIFTTVRPEFD